MKESKEKLFIEHFIQLLQGNMAKIYPISLSPNEFESGKSLAYYEIASLIIESSEIFKLSLDNFDEKSIDKLL